jgi:hypothetical protein
MEFHEFPIIYSVLKQNGLVEETADKFYAGALALLRVKATYSSSRFVSAAGALSTSITMARRSVLNLGMGGNDIGASPNVPHGVVAGHVHGVAGAAIARHFEDVAGKLCFNKVGRAST